MPPIVPVLVPGRMAVDKEYQGVGSVCRSWARAVSAVADICATALLVHAIDREAVPFCVQFQAFPEGTFTLFLPIATIVSPLKSNCSNFPLRLSKNKSPAEEAGLDGRSGWLWATPDLRPSSIKPQGSIAGQAANGPCPIFPLGVS